MKHRIQHLSKHLSKHLVQFVIFSLGIAGSAIAQSFPLSPNLWSNPEFQDRFLGSYGFDMEKTPKITADEQELFKQLLPLMESQPSAAAQQLRSSISAESSAALDYTLGNLHVQARNVPSAIRAYETAIRKFPNFFRAYKNLGLVLINEGRYEEAKPHLLKALELSGSDGSLYGPLGLVYLNLERPKQALTAYENALLFAPDNIQWQQGKLRALMDIGDFLAASAMLEEMILEAPENKDFWTWQANAFLSQKDTSVAAANLEVIKRLGKATATSLGLLGDIYLNDGLNDLALENYLAAADLEDLSSDRLLRTAEGLIRRQLWNEASTYLARTAQRIDELSPSETMTFRTLEARTALGNGELEKAAATLELIVAEDPMNGEALLTLANLKREQALFEDAAFHYEQAAKVESTKTNAMVEHARMLVTMRDYDAAASILQRVVVLDPSPRLESYLERVQSAARAASGRI
jgi:tetratricopeptide (TPR) repeat protein